MTNPFTLQLVSLKCLLAQEADGDEIYVEVDGRTVWSVGTRRMSERPGDDQISEVDFVNGTVSVSGGSAPIENFDADDFRFPAGGQSIIVQVKERDMLLGDDLIGQAAITPDAQTTGTVQLAFTAEGAHYLLNYRIT